MIILERESKKFQKTMRAQVGTTCSQINNPNTVESYKHLLVLLLFPHVKQEKRPEFNTMPALECH